MCVVLAGVVQGEWGKSFRDQSLLNYSYLNLGFNTLTIQMGGSTYIREIITSLEKFIRVAINMM
jgi:hypothetical protein